MVKIDGQTAGKVVGWSLATIALAVLTCLHLDSKVEVPVWARPIPGEKTIYICDTAPAWVSDEIQGAIDFWEARGSTFGPVVKTSSCFPGCNIPIGETPRWHPCKDGAIMIDVIDSSSELDHAGETLRTRAGNQVRRATILVPSEVHPRTEQDRDGFIVVQTLPNDVKAIILTHELGHAEGFDHSITRIFKGVTANRNGELMASRLEFSGWGDAGLPEKGNPKH
jgi:hypothetical protein